MIKIVHYRAKCIGCYACAEIAKIRWRMSKKDGKSVLLGGKEKKGIHSIEVEAEEYEINKLAEQMCPPKVIKVHKLKK